MASPLLINNLLFITVAVTKFTPSQDEADDVAKKRKADRKKWIDEWKKMKMEKKKVAALAETMATVTAILTKRKMKGNEFEVDTNVYWQRHYETASINTMEKGLAVYLSTRVDPLVKRIIRLDPTWSVATDALKNRNGLVDFEAISFVRQPKKGTKDKPFKFILPMSQMVDLITAVGKVREALARRRDYKISINALQAQHRKYGAGKGVDCRAIWKKMSENIGLVTIHFPKFHVSIKDAFYPAFQKGDQEIINFVQITDPFDYICFGIGKGCKYPSISIPIDLCNSLFEALLFLAKINKINCIIPTPTHVVPPCPVYPLGPRIRGKRLEWYDVFYHPLIQQKPYYVT